MNPIYAGTVESNTREDIKCQDKKDVPKTVTEESVFQHLDDVSTSH